MPRPKNSKEAYELITNIKHFGRFSTFNYLDVLNQITDLKHSPKYLNMLEAESCRKGPLLFNRGGQLGKREANQTEGKALA